MTLFDLLSDELHEKDIEIYCGNGSDVYYGKVKNVTSDLVKLEKDGRPIFVVMDKIQSVCIADK
jgi:hypothetical protein